MVHVGLLCEVRPQRVKIAARNARSGGRAGDAALVLGQHARQASRISKQSAGPKCRRALVRWVELACLAEFWVRFAPSGHGGASRRRTWGAEFARHAASKVGSRARATLRLRPHRDDGAAPGRARRAKTPANRTRGNRGGAMSDATRARNCTAVMTRCVAPFFRRLRSRYATRPSDRMDNRSRLKGGRAP